MSSDHSGYPLPSYVTQIWLAGDTIHLSLPSGPDGKSHIIRIPLAKCGIECGEWGSPLASQLGWQAILSILKAKQQERQAPPRLGDNRAPVQYDIDAMLRAVSTPGVKKFNSRGVEQIQYDSLDFGDQT